MKKTIYIAATSVFLFFVILPLFGVAADSFIKDGAISLKNYTDIFNGTTLKLVLKSITIAFNAALLSTLCGGFFAFTLNKTDLPLHHIFKLLLLIPLFISPYIIAVSWADFFILIGIGKDFIYSEYGVIFVMSIIYAPLAMIIIGSGLGNLSVVYEEAALMISDYKQTIVKIIIPLLKPAIFSAFILIFVLNLSEFTVPSFLSVNVLTTEIFTQFSAFYNYGAAVANSMILIVISISLLMLERFYLSDAPFLALNVRSHRTKRIALKTIKLPLLFTHAAYLLLSVFIPLIVLIIQSFYSGKSHFLQALSLLSPDISASVLTATFGAFILLIFGFIFAYLSEREKVKPLNLILLISFGIPSTVLGIGLIKFFNTPHFNFIYSGFWIIVIGYLGRFIFISEKLISNAIKQVPFSFEEAGELAGAGFFFRIRKIVIPLTADGLFAAFLISFIFSLGELGTTILIYPPGTSLLPVKVFTIMANAPQSLVSAMSLIVLLITLTALIILFIGQKLFFKKKWS